MRSSFVRNVVAPFALLAVALVAGHAQANAPPVSCQSDQAHHTVTLGANKDGVSITSGTSYWDTACGCYIAQIEVPSTSSPANTTAYTTPFAFGMPPTLFGSLVESQCKFHDRIYLYKKQADGTWDKVGGFEQKGDWTFGDPPLSVPGTPKKHFCGVNISNNSGNFGPFNPPASGTDKYRVLRSHEGPDGKFASVTVTAAHVASNSPH